jgi:transposase
MLALHPTVVDAIWRAVEGLLPTRPPDTHPLGCHRQRIPTALASRGRLSGS